MKTKRQHTVILSLIALLVWFTPDSSHGSDLAGSPPAAAVQPGRAPFLLSRCGLQRSTMQSPQTVPASSAVNQKSPLYTFTFGLIDYPRSQTGQGVGINDHGEIVG